jgi:hypothetical protein
MRRQPGVRGTRGPPGVWRPPCPSPRRAQAPCARALAHAPVPPWTEGDGRARGVRGWWIRTSATLSKLSSAHSRSLGVLLLLHSLSATLCLSPSLVFGLSSRLWLQWVAVCQKQRHDDNRGEREGGHRRTQQHKWAGRGARSDAAPEDTTQGRGQGQFDLGGGDTEPKKGGVGRNQQQRARKSAHRVHATPCAVRRAHAHNTTHDDTRHPHAARPAGLHAAVSGVQGAGRGRGGRSAAPGAASHARRPVGWGCGGGRARAHASMPAASS